MTIYSTDDLQISEEHLLIYCSNQRHLSTWGSHRSPAMKFPDLFLTKSQFLLTFCSMKIWYFDLSHNSHRSHRYQKIIAATVWQKNKLRHDIIYKMSNIMETRFPIFPFLVDKCETERPHHTTDTQNSKWGLHNDINSIFPDFFVNFKISWHKSKFTDFFLTLYDFNFFLTFHDLWESWIQIYWFYKQTTTKILMP